jgi:GxxExxY protein
MGQSEVIIKSLPFSPRDPEVEEDYEAFLTPLKPRLRSLLKKCRRALLNINNEVGAGYTDTIYRGMTLVELELMNLKHEAEVNVYPTFMDEPLPHSSITPILVESKALIEVKAIHDHISATDRSVMQSHLYATNAEVGLIACFTKERLLLRGVLP